MSEEDRTPRHRQHAQNICRSLDITQFQRYADVSIYRREHGLCDDSLHEIFRAVAVAKLMYASNAWWGFSNANDRQKIGLFAFIRRCIRTGFCSPDLADFLFLYVSSDEKLFNKILTCPNHILRTILPPPTAQNYSLRNIPHNRPDRISRITDCNFTVRILYRNMY